MFSEMFSPYKHVLAALFRKEIRHYLGNKKSAFLACTPEHVYAAIVESSKNNDLFSESPNLLLPDP